MFLSGILNLPSVCCCVGSQPISISLGSLSRFHSLNLILI